MPRTKTRKRMFKKAKARSENYKNNLISHEDLSQSLASYIGYLSHVNAFKLSQELKNYFWFNLT